MSQRARRPFWIHQFAEYLMGFVLISLIIQDTEPLVPVVMGVIIVLNAAAVRGPLSAFRGASRRAHRSIDVVIFALLLIAAVQPWAPESSTGRLALALIAIPFASSWYYTDWDEPAARKARRTAQGSNRSDAIGRRAGRVAGKGWRAVKNAGSDKPDTP